MFDISCITTAQEQGHQGTNLNLLFRIQFDICSFFTFEVKSRSSAMIFNKHDPSIPLVKVKRHGDRLGVGDSALASGSAGSCKGEGVVADNLNIGKSA